MLNELMEEYKESETEEEQLEYIHDFLDELWNSPYKYKKKYQYFTYEVNEKQLGGDDDLINLFNSYNQISTVFCKSFYKDDLNSIDYIRIHINNMYGKMVDENVYLPKEYYQLLLTPKTEYFETVKKIKNGHTVDFNEIQDKLESNLEKAQEIKNDESQKMLNMSWNEYQELINTFIIKLFNNYKLPEEYEDENGWEMRVSHDGWDEDNYLISYFCKSLTGYMRNYVKSLQPKEKKRRHCLVCNEEIQHTSNRKKYCSLCAKRIKNEQNKKYYHLGK